ncbi:MAG: hypothetical protein ABW250_27700 [Pyrinomonadaceae bacterium]
MNSPLPQTLDTEFKRLAKEEDKAMDELVEEIARLVNKSSRQIYNFRCGKWDVPASLIPILCKRFRSLALLNALADECRETQIEVPETYELTCLVSKTVRDDLHHYEKFLAAFEDGVITEAEMRELRASGDRVISNVHKFESIAQADLERRMRFHADVK